MKDGQPKGTGNSRYMRSNFSGDFTAFLAALNAGTLPFDLNGINAAGWDVLGDPLGKGTLLDDDTCALFLLSADAVPNDALQKIALAGKYAYGITVKNGNGAAMPGLTVTGITSTTGGAAITNSAGYVLGLASTNSVTLAIAAPYVDYNNYSAVATAGSEVITAINIVLQKAAVAERIFTTSSSVKFSPDVSEFDVCAIGGGGGGGGSGNYAGGGGGGGGYVANLLASINDTSGNYTLIVGAGGAGGLGTANTGISYSNAGTAGGSTIVYKNGNALVTANGGAGGGSCFSYASDAGTGGTGGAGNGSGGYGEFSPTETRTFTGAAASVYLFGEASLGLAGGGGGAGGIRTRYPANASGWSGGAPYGGATGIGGRGYGGGGAGNKVTEINAASTGLGGGSGAVIIRWRYTA